MLVKFKSATQETCKVNPKFSVDSHVKGIVMAYCQFMQPCKQLTQTIP